MKACLTSPLTMVILANCLSCSIGFVAPTSRTPSSTSNGTPYLLTSTVPSLRPRRDAIAGPLAAEKPVEGAGGDGDQEPMDLNLEQMFEVFEAADKEISDDTVGKRPDKSRPSGGKDAAEAMGDMLSSFFGGGGGDKK